MSNKSKNQPEEPFRLYWKYIEISKDFKTQEILYRIEDLFIYRVDLKRGIITIIANQGEAIPREAIPITKEVYEVQILKYIL